MQTILLISHNEKSIETYLKELFTEENISPFDVQTIESGEGESKKSSIGIAQIRAMQKTVFLMPSQGKKKAVVIHNADMLTIEAQNALLKLLEEPPTHTMFILIAKNQEALLPTTLSRCTIVFLDEDTQSDKDTIAVSSITEIRDASVGQRLKIAQDAAKHNPLGFVESLITKTSTDLVAVLDDKKTVEQYIRLLDQLHKAQKTLKTTQTNPRLLLENLLLSIE